jgi:hypothetical protein
LGSPFGQRTSGVGVVEGVWDSGVVVGSTGDILLLLAVEVGRGLTTSDRKLPMKIAAATTMINASASTPMIRLSRCSRDGPVGGPLCAGSVGVEPLAGLSPGAGRRGSSVVTLDHLDPSQ